MIKNPHYLIIGNKYKISHPVYDDFNEGLKPDIEIIEVIKKYKNSFLLKNIELDFTYEISFEMLMDCIIEEIYNK